MNKPKLLQFSLNSLLVFNEVAKYKSFSKAAQALFISQPAVTKHIKRIELKLGMGLIQKRRGGFSLTDTGKIILKYTQKISAHFMEMENVLGSLQKSHYGLLKIGTTESYCRCLMTKLLSAFQTAFPSIKIALDVGNSEQIETSLLTYHNELALIGVTSRISSRFESHPFSKEELVLVVPPTHPLATSGPVSLKKLEEYPLIIREEGSMTRKILLRAFSNLGIRPSLLIEAGSPEFIKQWVSEGKGVSVIGKMTVEDEEKRGIIKSIPLLEKLYLKVAFIYLKEEHSNPTINAFINFVESQGRKFIKS